MFRPGRLALRRLGDQTAVPDPLSISRRIRRRIARDGVRADVAADVSLVVSTGVTSATQSTNLRQSRRGSGTADEKEQP